MCIHIESQPDYKSLKDFCNLDSMHSEGSGSGSGSLSDFAPLREPLNSPVIIEISGKLISLKFSNKENDADVKFLETLEYCVFNSNIGLWQITDYRNNLQLIQQYFGTRIVRKTDGVTSKIPKTDGATPSHPISNPHNSYNEIRLEITTKKIFLKMPKNSPRGITDSLPQPLLNENIQRGKADISFLNSFKYTRFNKATFLWEVPNYKNTLQIIKEYFGARINEIKEQENQQSEIIKKEKRKQKPNTVEIEIINSKHIVVYFPFSFEHVKKMKTLPLYYYQAEDKSWKFPYTENILSELESYFKKFNYTIECTHTSVKDKGSKEKKNYGNERQIPEEYLEKLKLIRYSDNTIRTYTVAFTDFINYYSSKKLDEITQEDIKNYLLYLVEKRKVSSSFQNQIINAIHPVGLK